MISRLFERLASAHGEWLNKARTRSVLAFVLGLTGVAIYARAVNRVYPIKDWLFWRLVPLWGYSALFAVASLTVGHEVLRRLLPEAQLTRLQRLTLSISLGIIVFVFGLYVGGAAHQFNAPFALALPAVCIAVGARGVWRAFGEPTSEASLPLGPFQFLALLAGGAAVALLYLQAMTPDAINFDASWYHIPIAQDYARHHRIVQFPGDYNRAFPHLASMIYTWGYLVPGLSEPQQWMITLHFEFTIVLFRLLGIATLAEWMLARKVRGTWAAFLLFPSIFVYDQNLGASSDHFMGFWACPTVLCVGLLLKDPTPRKGILLGAVLGGAMLTKYQAIYTIVAAAVIVGGYWIYRLRRQRQRGEPLRQMLALPGYIAIGAALCAAPHFLKNAIFYGNPVYPFGQAIFRTSDPMHEKSLFFFSHLYASPNWVPKGTALQKLTHAV
ncbi:MAG: hypothetical protein EXR75_08000, partial [Myxococcales bacterium]|nr:hypothetical protein [Myxococcales bacterium]